MAIPGLDLAGAALGAAGGGAAPNGAGFEDALKTAAGGAGGGGDQEAQMLDSMVETGVQVMGGMMMRMANDMLAEGMADDEG